MTTSAAIAPSTNSFTSSLGHSGRFFSSGKTSDATKGVLSPPDDDSSAAQDSGSDDGSSFHSVLNQFYSSQDDSGSPSGRADASGKTNAKGDSKGDASSTAPASPSVQPLSDDGTQLRTKSSVLATLSASSTSVSTQSYKAPDKNDPKTSAAADDSRTQVAQLPASNSVQPPIVVSAPESEPDTDQPGDVKAGPVPEPSQLQRTVTVLTSDNPVEPSTKPADTNLAEVKVGSNSVTPPPAATQSAPQSQQSEPVVVPAEVQPSDAATFDPPQAPSSKTTSIAKPIISSKSDQANDTKPTVDALP